jgi:AmmeMemoRadiSam system protein B
VTRADRARRRPAVAGQFYPADPDELLKLVAACLDGVPDEARHCRAAIAPHAGLVYSGRCAGAVFGRLRLPPTVVILAPNHTGICRSPGASLYRQGAFETPLGAVPVDAALSEALLHASDLVAHDPAAHQFEHAIEVELPFVVTRAAASAIVPIVIAWDDWARTIALADALVSVVSSWPTEVLLLASSDMTHYESASEAEIKDRAALEAIAALDGQALLETCARRRITMCGRVPAAAVLDAARRLGASKAELVDYRHSGEVTGEHSSVVSYAGVVIA